MNLDEAVAAARVAPGETTLTEPQAAAIARALGIATPAAVVVGGPRDPVPLASPRVVVKAIGPAHRAVVGGVVPAANRPEAIAAAIDSIATALPGTREYLIAEWVDHDPEREVLAGVRWTDAFGPVVTLGRGGIGAESGPPPALLAGATLPGARAMLARTLPGEDPDALLALAGTLLEFAGAAMPATLTEFEINPVVFTASGPIALDALAVRGDHAPSTRPRPARDLTPLLHPGSIAVIGVSAGDNPGRIILRNILAAGFPADRITVIKPGTAAIEGCRCVPDLASLPAPADLLVIALDAASTPDLMDAVVDTRAARSAILIPGGLGERPGTQAAAQRISSALDHAGSSRPTVIGPNSMGVRSRPGSYDATFIPRERMTPAGAPSPGADRDQPVGAAQPSSPRLAALADPPQGGKDRGGSVSADGTLRNTRSSITPPLRGSRQGEALSVGGGIAVVSQSGAFILSRLDRLPHLEPRYVISVGNQLDVTVGDCLEHLADDPEVGLVACYLEGFAPGDGDRALRAVRRMRDRNAPVIWYRGGRSDHGARAAATHTAALATDDVVARALGAAAGALEAESLDDFEDLIRIGAAFRGQHIPGNRVGIVSNAGFECVAAADAMRQLVPAALADATHRRLGELLADAGLGAVTSPGNPLDLTPMADDALFSAAVAAVLDDPGVDVAVVGCVPFSPALRTLPEQVRWPGSLAVRLADLATHDTPWLAVVDGGRHYDPMADLLTAAGVPVLRSMDRAVRLVDRYVQHA